MALDVIEPTKENSADSRRTRARSKSPFVKTKDRSKSPFRTKDRSKSPFKTKTTPRNKSPFKPLASEDSLGNSNTSRSMDDEANWLNFKSGDFDDLSKRTHSLASTATLTSNESSHGNGSFRNCEWSPTQSKRRLSNSFKKSPRRSPRHAFLLSDLSDSGRILSPPLTNGNGQAPENDRGVIKNNRRYNGVDGPPKDGLGTYYQPSKASLGDSNSKKPQRIRNRSKGPLLRRKSNGDAKASSQRSERSASVDSADTTKSDPLQGGTRARSRSRERKAKKKSSPAITGNRKKPSNTKTAEKPQAPETKIITTSTSLHESWPRPHRKDDAIAERQKQRNRPIEKPKLTEKSKRKIKITKTKKKEGKDEKCNDINHVITFFEDMASNKAESERSNAPPSRGLGKKSNSARCVTKRFQSPTRSSIGDNSAHATLSDKNIMDTSNRRRERRSSAPAKAMAAFHQYKQSVGASEFEDFDDPKSPQPEKIMLDVSELAALEIIRLGKDNSLKLDIFDLMEHLKQQQLQKKRK